jgi:hypothetical protein
VKRCLVISWLCLSLVVTLGCTDDDSGLASDAGLAARTSRYDATTAGIIRGHVLWKGDIPGVPGLKVGLNPAYGPPFDKAQLRDNPNAPIVDPYGRGVADAVVFLEGVDADNARPWNHGPLHIEQQDGRIHIRQEGLDSRIGFVRPTDDVVLVSKDSYPHALRASGAAFFTLTFPDPGQPLVRRFEHKGRVELTSGLGYYWMRGHLFVDEHPYYARTDSRGRFVLRDVPPGHYRLVCWHPSWIEDSHERDPETCLISRYFFRPPVVQKREVEVAPRATTAAHFHLSSDLFRH